MDDSDDGPRPGPGCGDDLPTMADEYKTAIQRLASKEPLSTLVILRHFNCLCAVLGPVAGVNAMWEVAAAAAAAAARKDLLDPDLDPLNWNKISQEARRELLGL